MGNERRKAYRSLIRDYPQANLVTAWLFPPEDFPAWIAAGLGEADSYAEYAARVDEFVRVARSLGQRVKIWRGRVSQLLAFMAENDLPNEPAYRAEAIGFLATEAELKRRGR